MASFKSRDREPEVEAARLKRQFKAVSRRIEWRTRLQKAMWWLTVCAVASTTTFAGTWMLASLGVIS
jgi:hypothetical protein